jgi:hypothetical protein
LIFVLAWRICGPSTFCFLIISVVFFSKSNGRLLMKKETGIHYGLGVPRNIPEGRVLAHDTVQHDREWASGRNGFRWWTWPKENKPRHFLRCQCGWVDLPHYAIEEHAKSFKCKTVKPLAPGAGRIRITEE